MRKKSGKVTRNLPNYRILCTEIFKTLKNLNLVFLKNTFRLRETEQPVRNKYKLGLEIPKRNEVRFVSKNLKCLGPTYRHKVIWFKDGNGGTGAGVKSVPRWDWKRQNIVNDDDFKMSF